MSEHRELPRHAPPIRTLSRKSQAALPLASAGAGMLVRRLRVSPADVVFVKGVVEASDGLAGVFAERGGDLHLAAPHEREDELLELLADLEAELVARPPPIGPDGGRPHAPGPDGGRPHAPGPDGGRPHGPRHEQ